MQRVGQVVAALKFTMPKTDETIRLLNRYLTDAIPSEGMEDDSGPLGRMGRLSPSQQREIARRNDAEFRSRGTAWILGSSFAFEGVVFGVAAWMFRRRDF